MELYSEIMLKGLQSVRNDIKSTFDALMIEQEPTIREWIRNRWLLGKRPDGSLIGIYGDFFYAENKFEQHNKQAGFGQVDLILTGTLWKGIEIFNTSQGIEIDSTDIKFGNIAQKYGIDNFNITPKETEQLIDEISTATIELLYQKYL